MPPKKRSAPKSPPKSPTPGPSTAGPSTVSQSPPRKRGRVVGTPVKTNKERELESKQNQHPSTTAQRTLGYIGCDSAQRLLKGAIDLDDYRSRLPYFFGCVFLAVRDLRQNERKAICKQTMPGFTQGDEEVIVNCEEAFEEAYRLTQFHFISRIIKYGRQWIRSKAGTDFREKTTLAKKRKKPILCPQPELPSKPEHMMSFGGEPGITWDKLQSIDFWAVCLCAFELEENPDEAFCRNKSNGPGPRWFLEDREKSGALRKELDGVALELIRRYAVFEILHPNGYNSTEMVKSLRDVMPAISFSKKSDLRELFTDLGVTIKDCGERPGIPNATINLASYTKEIDNDQSNDNEKENPAPTALQKAELQQVDTSNTRVGSGLPALDDDVPSGYAVYEVEARKAQELVNRTFADTFKQHIASDDEPLLSSEAVIDIVTDEAMMCLHPPKILQSDVARRADAYAKGNIWVRSLIGAADRMLEDHRLNALMIAAQQQREMIQYESLEAQKEIDSLRKKHELLMSAWASVDQAANERDALRAEQSRLESVLHGGGSIAGALSGRFKAIPAHGGNARPGTNVRPGINHARQGPGSSVKPGGGARAIQKEGVYNTLSRQEPRQERNFPSSRAVGSREEPGLGFIPSKDPIPLRRYATGGGFQGFAAKESTQTSPKLPHTRQGASNHNSTLSDKGSDTLYRNRHDSSSSTTSKIALSQPQSQSKSQQRSQPQALHHSVTSGSVAEMNALRDQIEEEIDLGRYLDESIEAGSDERNEGNYSDDGVDHDGHADRDMGADDEGAEDDEVAGSFDKGELGDEGVYGGEGVGGERGYNDNGGHDGEGVVEDSTQNSSGNLQQEEQGVKAHLLDG